ncbi:MAG: DUF308 domain-containing protein [Candidatus Acidiferrales bacterium]
MNTSTIASDARQVTGWSIAVSLLLILAGILAIGLPIAAGFAVSIVVGWLLVFCGVIHLVFAWHIRSVGGVIWQVLLGALYIGIGVFILIHPLAALVTLTLALAIYLFAEGLLELILAFQVRPQQGWGWLLFDGVVTLFLAVLIWRGWPRSTDWVIGMLVGISMIFSGVTRLMLSLAARSLVPRSV